MGIGPVIQVWAGEGLKFGWSEISQVPQADSLYFFGCMELGPIPSIRIVAPVSIWLQLRQKIIH